MIWFTPALAWPQAPSFQAYGGVRTWTGVDTPDGVQVYDAAVYQGHAEFVSRGLKTGMRFREFKAAVRDADRTYLPFFLYDLTGRGVVVDGRTITWAVRVEDYVFVDSDTSLGLATARTATRLAERWSLPVDQGLVVLASSDTVRPNTKSAAPVGKAGFVHATLGALQRSAPVVDVLNPGVAVGWLRNTGRPEPHDIRVYTELPRRVPPVAGVITHAPQTPLSHVNLLARNRGTPNVVVRDPAVLGRMDRLVRLEARETLVITDISESDAAAWWAAHPPPAVSVPRAQPIGMVDLRERPPVEHVGAKASNYATLQALFPKTHRGFALGFAAYLNHVKPLSSRIESFLRQVPDDPIERGAELAAIRHAIRALPLDPAVLREVRVAIDSLEVARVRLRSSTNNEDLPHFNGAGLYTSKGFDTDGSESKLEKKLKKVFSSLWNEEAFEERTFHGVDHAQVAMAVLLHEAFSDELANGVALTIPTSAGVEIVINAQPGEVSVANPSPGTVPEGLRLNGATQVESRSSIGPVFTGSYAVHLEELERQVRRIHEEMVKEPGFGVDVEFKLTKTGVVLKQARLLAPARVD